MRDQKLDTMLGQVISGVNALRVGSPGMTDTIGWLLEDKMTRTPLNRVGVFIAVLALALLSSPPAHADPGVDMAPGVEMAPKHYSKATRDGWNLNIAIDGERIDSVPNLADAVNSREAFVTFSATATASGGSSPITDSLFIAGYQLGCQSDVSTGTQIGGEGAIGITGGLTGWVQTLIQPGEIVDLPLTNMALDKGGRAMLDVDSIHLKVDDCGGDVSVRSYAYLRISTAAAHTAFAVYGDPLKI